MSIPTGPYEELPTFTGDEPPPWGDEPEGEDEASTDESSAPEEGDRSDETAREDAAT